MSIYQHWRLKGLFLSLQQLQNSNIQNKEEEEKRIREYYNPQKAFEEIANNQYISEEETKAAIAEQREPNAI